MNEQTAREWAARIYKHAQENYNDDGWDFVVETMTEEEIIECFNERISDGQACTTYEEALAEVKYRCKLLDDRRRDIQGTEF